MILRRAPSECAATSRPTQIRTASTPNTPKRKYATLKASAETSHGQSPEQPLRRFPENPLEGSAGVSLDVISERRLAAPLRNYSSTEVTSGSGSVGGTVTASA